MIDPLGLPLHGSADVEADGAQLRVSRETETSWLIDRAVSSRARRVARVQLTPDGWHADPVHEGAADSDQPTWAQALQAAAHFPLRMHPARKLALLCLVISLASTVGTLIYGALPLGTGVPPALWVVLAVNLALLVVTVVALLVARAARWDPRTGTWKRLPRRERETGAPPRT